MLRLGVHTVLFISALLNTVIAPESSWADLCSCEPTTGGSWFLDEGSGMVVHDQCGGDNSGTITGSGVSWFAGTPCRGRTSLHFEGGDDPSSRVEVADAPEFDSLLGSAMTVVVWFYLTNHSTITASHLMSKWGPGGLADDSWDLLIDSLARGGRLIFRVSGGSDPSLSEAMTDIPVPAGEWLMARGTFELGGEVRVYLYNHGGELLGYGATPARSGPQDTSTLVYLGNGENQMHEGWIAAARISADVVGGYCLPDPCATAVLASSWGEVKHLYR